MAVAIRLNRQGSKDRPYYKIVVVDSRARRDGRYIEQVGSYDPMKEGVNYTINLKRLTSGLPTARATQTVNSMIRRPARPKPGSSSSFLKAFL
ncbi:MAG: 30S ribosomal protein S16 [Akkermansia sp.]